MKSLSFVLFILIATFLACPDANASNFYVATSGNDNNAGDQNHPWRTLQHAVDTIGNGDTILVETGTYVGCRIGSSGQAGAVRTLRADIGAAVLINGPGSANRHTSNLELENFNGTISYWVIDGFEVANAPRYGIDLRDTDHITVQNCYVHNSTVTGIFLAFCYHPLIQFNQSASNGEHGIYQSNSGDYPTIRGNILHHNVSAGIHMNGDRNFTPGDGIISFALVEKNVIYENGAPPGGGSGINCDGVSDSVIINNLLYNNHASGISLYAIDGAEGSSRNKVYNNTILMASDGRWCINIPAAAEGQTDPVGNKVKNNILYTPHTFRGSISTYSSSVSGFESDYNTVVNRFSIDDGDTNMSLAGWQALGYDTHSVVSTPASLFVNPAVNDYHLKSGSTAVDAGTSLAEVTQDLDGIPRPQGTAYDTGCYERSQCTLALSPGSAAFTRSGGDASFAVTAPGGCAWTAVSNDGFINVTSGNGSGNGLVSYSVSANTGPSTRSGTISVGGSVFTVYQAVDFTDVPPTHLFYTEISKIYARGITIGCAAASYCPDQVVTREQMAAFIIRSLGDFNPPTPAAQRFLDVPSSNPFYAFIDEMAARQITLGCGGGNYCPGSPVLREQMAAFIIRALGEFDPPAPPTQRFLDVPSSNVFYNFIDRMAVLNITLGCGGGNYCPSQSVTRGQMAAFLVRAFDL
jgi:parallel beta-helix repeat protein